MRKLILLIVVTVALFVPALPAFSQSNPCGTCSNDAFKAGDATFRSCIPICQLCGGNSDCFNACFNGCHRAYLQTACQYMRDNPACKDCREKDIICGMQSLAVFSRTTVTIAQPLTNYPMLGDVEPGSSVRTPVFQIKVWPNGFDRYRKNTVRGTTNWMNTNGFGGFVPEFQSIANDIPNLVANIDSAYQDALNAWSSCYPAVVNLNSRSLVVTIEPAPFTHPSYPPDFYISGIVDGNQIRVVDVHIHSSLIFMQNYKTLALWEFNNWFACQLGICPQNQSQEQWAQHPCQ